ncbi:hypothetical protein ANN_09617 [Periplaneta americana]|uniref:Uncharacterized protein n=1 Tax=Periplaneta americana TaxID=6978 RepID=A0ABQ8TLV5_PERAM|nr:hypothetical protein ANN_09617 [Periplaneta americana]
MCRSTSGVIFNKWRLTQYGFEPFKYKELNWQNKPTTTTTTTNYYYYYYYYCYCYCYCYYCYYSVLFLVRSSTDDCGRQFKYLVNVRTVRDNDTVKTF